MLNADALAANGTSPIGTENPADSKLTSFLNRLLDARRRIRFRTTSKIERPTAVPDMSSDMIVNSWMQPTRPVTRSKWPRLALPSLA